MSYEFYKLLHIVGVLLLVCSLGALAMQALFGRDRKDVDVTATRKRLLMWHGIAMLVVVVAGFGLMAKLKLMSTWPTWILIKLGVWFLLGGATVAIRRSPGLARAWVVLVPILAGVGVAVVVYKPG